MSSILLILACFFALASARRLNDDLLDQSISRILGGVNATRGEFPHIVSIQKGNEDSHYCGGSILNENWILTAAHCVNSESEVLHVKAGKHAYSYDEDTVQKIKVDRIIVHENFDGFEFLNDINLLKLKEPLQFNKFVQPIKLPEKDSQVDGDVVAAGWGLIDSGLIRLSPSVLQKVTLPVVDFKTCKKIVDKLTGGHPAVQETEICTGRLTEERVTTCTGDSGGPLMKIKGNGKAELVGITSWGVFCGLAESPSMFTRVSAYIDWIESTMSKN